MNVAWKFWNWHMGMGQKYWWNQHPLTSYDHPGTIRVPGFWLIAIWIFQQRSGKSDFATDLRPSPSPSLVHVAPFEVTIIYQYFEMFYKVTGHVLGVQPKLGSTDDVYISRWTFRTRGGYIFPFRGTARYLTIGKTLIWRHDWNGLIFIVCIVLMIVAIFTNF